MGRFNFFLKSPKKEQLVPDSLVTESSDSVKDVYSKRNAGEEIDIMDELEGILSIDDEEMLLQAGENMSGYYHEWNFMNWDEFPIGSSDDTQFKEDEFEEEEDDGEEGEEPELKNTIKCLEERHNYSKDLSGIDKEEERSLSLNLSLNYQDVLDAWSNRGSLWADDHSISMANNSSMGEVPVMEEERTRRKASVLRYKEKRQNRLFSKKIRYQVRKLNADKRPRLKGRFVKRLPVQTKYLNELQNISKYHS